MESTTKLGLMGILGPSHDDEGISSLRESWVFNDLDNVMVSPGQNDEMKLAGRTTNRPSNPLNQVAYLPVPIAAFE